MVNDLEVNKSDRDSAKAVMKITQPPARFSDRLAAKQISVEKIQKKIISKPEKKKDEDIVMECFSWIFSDDDVNYGANGVRRTSLSIQLQFGQQGIIVIYELNKSL